MDLNYYVDNFLDLLVFDQLEILKYLNKNMKKNSKIKDNFNHTFSWYSYNINRLLESINVYDTLNSDQRRYIRSNFFYYLNDLITFSNSSYYDKRNDDKKDNNKNCSIDINEFKKLFESKSCDEQEFFIIDMYAKYYKLEQLDNGSKESFNQLKDYYEIMILELFGKDIYSIYSKFNDRYKKVIIDELNDIVIKATLVSSNELKLDSKDEVRRNKQLLKESFNNKFSSLKAD